MTVSIIDLLRDTVMALEEKLTSNAPHECRFCMWFACDSKQCKCGCGSVGRERAIHLARLKYLLECAETGELPPLEQAQTNE